MPFNLNYIGSQDAQLIFSDCDSSNFADMGSYFSIFTSISTKTVMSLFVCSLQPAVLQPKNCQLNIRTGNAVNL